MSRWRIIVVVSLLALPFVLWAVAGSYYLWTLNWGLTAWFVMAACMATGYLLAWYWQRTRQLLGPLSFDPQPHWTDRDAAAWKIVEARAKAAEKLDPALLSDVNYYLKSAQELALDLAKFYHPRAYDPISSVTIPEVLAVVELATHDLGKLVDQYVPGGHLLTINDWRRAKQATDWYDSAKNAWWLLSALFAPLQTGTRFAAAQIGLTGPLHMLQQNLILWFHTAYLHRFGTYLIELNSGRLRVGAERYRQLMEKGPDASPTTPAEPPPRQVIIALIGQVKAGKSSLINAMLGERRVLADVLPSTSGVNRYELKAEGLDARLVLLDTPGYAHAGPDNDQLAATREAARQADVVFLVLHAKNPGRQADANMIQSLRQWFSAHPELKQPPLMAVLTHIDLLSPSMEWSPPYDWRNPTRPKEQHIHQAALAAREQLGNVGIDVIPVCLTPGKIFGVEEDLLPAIASRLDDAHGIALLRCLHAEADEGKVRKVFHQLLAVGREAAKFAWTKLSS